MPRTRRRAAPPTQAEKPAAGPTVIERVMDLEESSLLDLLDHVLNKGVMATGDITLGVAGIDLIYIRLSALLCAADRVLPPSPRTPAARARRRQRTRQAS
ncbi:MAG TPA: gas vesicle protein [Vicinamibacterales bacterium]|nr:gas vesicle protein [Vicinamibacterales bacterium]